MTSPRHRRNSHSWLATLKSIFLGCLGSLVLAVFVSRCVNINRFSLHALYRNRLIRAFLGASRKRKPTRSPASTEATIR